METIENEGEAIDLMFKWVNDPKIAVGTRNYAVTALHKITKKYPDLKPELIAVLEDQMDKNPISFKMRAKRILKDIQ